MLNAIAIDDEPIALEVVRNFAAKVTYVNLNACFTNPLEACGYLQSHRVDLLILDIEMPDLKGTHLLRSLPRRPLVIFTTAHSEHAVESFELDAVDYLLKPFSFDRFLKACHKANQHHERSTQPQTAERSPVLFVKSGYDQVRLEIDQLRYIESQGNYVRFVTAAQSILSRLTMAEASALLPGNRFIRVHRSYIVNKAMIQRIDKYSVFIGESELPIGRGYSSAIEQIISKP
jgi:DNA-binding LytR/AlgR family response regulator